MLTSHIGPLLPDGTFFTCGLPVHITQKMIDDPEVNILDLGFEVLHDQG
jgi:hypothetical protein